MAQILRMYTRNSTGGMVPLGSLMDVQRINGPDTASQYNVYPAAGGDVIDLFLGRVGSCDNNHC
jgi:hypothetical protein